MKKIAILSFVCALILPLASRAQAAAPIDIEKGGIHLKAQNDGTVTITDKTGKERIAISGYALEWEPIKTYGGDASLITLPNGAQAIKVDYHLNETAAQKVRISGEFSFGENGVKIQMDTWGPEKLNMRGAMLMRKALPAQTREFVYKASRWARDANGGVPFEEPLGYFFAYQWPDLNAAFYIPGANQNWHSTSAVNFPGKAIAKGHFRATADVVLGSARFAALTAHYQKRPLSLEVWTEKDFNIWDDNAAPLTLHTQTVNTSDAQKPVELSWWARNYDGNIVEQGKQSKVLLSGQSWNCALQFPAAERDILFVEVVATSGKQEVFRRTNLAVLPQYNFTSGKESIFGMAADFEYPTKAAMVRLLQRIGVRWLRTTRLSAEEAAEAGLWQDFHSNITPEEHADDPAKRREWILQQLRKADKNDAVYWEFGNEWNMKGGTGKAQYADVYAKEWLPLVNQVRQESGAKVKLMSMGLAGMDEPFMKIVYEAGAWDLFESFGLHPGRGNYTPDFLGKDGEYWNFLGSIRKAKAMLAQYGEKPISITEAYACTQPNSHWHDSLRHAAENVVLSYALAQAEGVRVMDWYQLNNGTWFAPNEARPADSEFYYGLLNSDLSPKASLLAYNAIAKALDGATFKRELQFKDGNNKGLLFETPRGPMAVLWNRSDGYFLNGPNNSPYAAPEAWIDPWKTKVPLVLSTRNDAVQVVDHIGRKRQIAATNHQVQITLDGAAQIVYGIDASAIP